MLTRLIKQPSVRGIAAGAKATVEIPTTGTHLYLLLRCKTAAGAALTVAQMKAAINLITIRLNGVAKYEGTAKFFLDRQKYYGDAHGAGNVDGIIAIPYIRQHLPTLEGRMVTAWGMQDITSYTVDIDVVTVASLASIEVLSEVDMTPRRLGQHIEIRRHPFNFANTGLDEINSLPRFAKPGNLNDSGYLAMHIEAGNGTFSNVTVKVNNEDYFQEVDPNLNKVYLQSLKRTPQAGYFHIDFARNNNLLSLLPMSGVQDFRQQITWITAAPDNYNVYAETIHGLKVA